MIVITSCVIAPVVNADPGTDVRMAQYDGALTWRLRLEQVNGTYRELVPNAMMAYTESFNTNFTGTNAIYAQSSAYFKISKGSDSYIKESYITFYSTLTGKPMYLGSSYEQVKVTEKNGVYYLANGDKLSDTKVSLDSEYCKFSDIAVKKYTKKTETGAKDGFPTRYTIYINKRANSTYAISNGNNKVKAASADIKYDPNGATYTYTVGVGKIDMSGGTYSNNLSSQSTTQSLNTIASAFANPNLVGVVSTSNTAMFNYVESQQAFEIKDAFKRCDKNGSIFDIGLDWSMSSDSSGVFSTYTNYNAYRKYWSVPVKYAPSDEDVKIDFANNSVISNEIASPTTDVKVYVTATGTAPFGYRVGYTPYDNVDKDKNKYKDESKVNWVNTKTGIKPDTNKLGTESITFSEIGEYAVVVGVTDKKHSDYVYVCLHVDVKEYTAIEELDNQYGGNGANGGTEDESSVMPDRSQIAANRELTYVEQQKIDEINSMHQTEVELGIWSWVYTIASLCGICLLCYSLLLLVAYYVDTFNSFTDFSFLQLLTFGKMYPVGNKENIEHLNLPQDKGKVLYTTNATIWLSFCIGVIGAAVLMNVQSLILIFFNLSNWFNDLIS